MAENENTTPEKKPESTGSNPDQPAPGSLKRDSEDSILDFGVTAPLHEGASGVIPLAQLPDPTSSPSLVSWTEVIRQHRESTQGAPADAQQPVKVDSVSDKDLLERIVSEEQRQAAPPKAKDTDKLSDIPIVTDKSGSGSGSSIQFRAGKITDPTQPLSGSAVRFDVMESPSDAGGAIPSPWAEQEIPEALAVDSLEYEGQEVPMAQIVSASDSDLLFTAESDEGGSVAKMLHDELSADIADLPPGAPGASGVQSSILDVLIHEENLEPQGSSRRSSDIVDVAAPPESGVLAKLQQPSSMKGQRQTSETEGAVDLYAEGPAAQGVTESGSLRVSEEHMEEAAKRQKIGESSAIDLSSNPMLSSQFDLGESEVLHGKAPSVEEIIEAETVDEHEAADEYGAPKAPARQRSRAAEPAYAAEAEEANEPVRERPRRPAKAAAEPPRKKGGGLLLGTTLGLILGVGGLGAAYYFEQLPSDPKSLFGGSSDKNKGGGNQTQTPDNTKPPTAAAATPELARQFLDAGDPAKAVETYAKCDQSSAEVLAGQGRAKWLAYLHKTTAPKQQDAEVTTALNDLKAALAKWEADKKAMSETDAARAYLWQGMIAESFGDTTAAGKIYADAEAKIGPTNKAIITNAANRLKALGNGMSAPVARLNQQELVLAFTLLLADEPTGVPPEKELAGQECGFLFWEAMLQASQHNYAKAADMIPKVKAVHARQQIKMAGKGLNPLSDPREQMLPASLDELQRCWLLCDQLYKRPESRQLVEQRKLPEALAAAFAKSKDGDDLLKVVAEKLMLKKDQNVAEAIDSVIKSKEKAETGKKAADDTLAAVAKSLKDAGIDDPKVEDGLKKLAAGKTDADAKLKFVGEALDKAGVKEPDLGKALALVIAARDSGESTVKGLRERLEKAKIVDPNANQAALFKAIDDAITRGSSDAVTKLGQEKKDAEAKVAKLAETLDATKKESELALTKAKKDLADQKTAFESRLTGVRTPAQVVDVWLPALADKDRPADAAAALADAEAVLNNPGSDETVKSKALAVKALALRHQGKVTDARAAFAEARKAPGFEKAKQQPWAQEVARAADNLANPAAFVGIAPPAAPPTPQKVMELVENGLKLFPADSHAKDHARLLAQRSRLKLDANDLPGAEADAKAAANLGAGVDGSFALARIFEKQGKFDEALQAYRDVIQKDEGSALGAQARLGMARVLLQRSAAKPAKSPAPGTTSRRGDDTLGRLALMTILFAAPEPANANDVLEALKLADALIAQKEYLGHIIKADALAKLGRYNDALTEYSTGIKALKALPKEYDGVLDRILANHPGMQRPDASVVADESLAFKHYGEGLELYRRGDFAKSEGEFVQAVRHNNQDARYLYFLGLSRWQQGKRDSAAESFEDGAKLELKGRPTFRVVNESLESVQGELRRAVEKYRP
jgi:hypothetical protein